MSVITIDPMYLYIGIGAVVAVVLVAFIISIVRG